MLKSLFISSFVIIDQTQVDFEEGMTALTGETGAGKSIIINALEQLCGARASSSLVRKGAKKAREMAIAKIKEVKKAVGLIGDVYKD